MSQPSELGDVTVPAITDQDAFEDWAPPGYKPGPDNPGPVTLVTHHHDTDDGVTLTEALRAVATGVGAGIGVYLTPANANPDTTNTPAL